MVRVKYCRFAHILENSFNDSSHNPPFEKKKGFFQHVKNTKENLD